MRLAGSWVVGIRHRHQTKKKALLADGGDGAECGVVRSGLPKEDEISTEPYLQPKLYFLIFYTGIVKRDKRYEAEKRFYSRLYIRQKLLFLRVVCDVEVLSLRRTIISTLEISQSKVFQGYLRSVDRRHMQILSNARKED